ncbi:hypothetical protein ABPG75_006552 [Micractinium tetrahymenae]
MEEAETAPRPRLRQRRPSSAPAAPGGPGADAPPPHSESSSDSVKVFVRIRPSGVAGLAAAGVPEEGATPLQQVRDDALRVSGGGPEAKVFALHGVLGPHRTQADVYGAVGPLVLDSVRGGYNASVLAYGQTGSGKTHTMLGRAASAAGPGAGLGEDAGVIPRSFDDLFRWLAAQPGEASVQCSVVEIYIEKITDLLQPGGHSLPLLGDGAVKGLTWHTMKAAGDVMRLLDRAAASRQTAATRMNAASSRSHMVLQCRVELRVALAAAAAGASSGGGRAAKRGSVAVRVRRSLLSFVDLAGSERQKMAGTEGERLAEGAAINKSLLALSKVIYTLAAAPSAGGGTSAYVPYRDSVLTRLLQPSLGGNSRTVLLATVSPDRSCLAETLSTLEFAQRAKYVVNKVVAHDEVVEQPLGPGSGSGPGGASAASAAQLAATAAELAERDARIAGLLRQLDSVAVEAAEQRQEAERRARALAEQAAASVEAALEAARQQAQALAAASLERQATGVRDAAAAQLMEQEWELQEARGELEAARGEVQQAQGQLEATQGQLEATRGELEQAWQTQRMLAENLTQALASNAKLEARLQAERAAHAKMADALRSRAAAAAAATSEARAAAAVPAVEPSAARLHTAAASEDWRAEQQEQGSAHQAHAAVQDQAAALQARLAGLEAQEREQAMALQARLAGLEAQEQEQAALQARLASGEAWQREQAATLQAREARLEAGEHERATLQARLARSEARQQEQAAALEAAGCQVERLRAQLHRQTGDLQQERSGWLALAGRLQAALQETADEQEAARPPAAVCQTGGCSVAVPQHAAACGAADEWHETQQAWLHGRTASPGWRASCDGVYGRRSLL